MTKQEFIEAIMDLVADYIDSKNTCEFCGAEPMRANCNNADCDTTTFNNFLGMNVEDELEKLTIRRTTK